MNKKVILSFLDKKRPINAISYAICGVMTCVSLLLLYFVDSFFSAIYYIDFQSKLQSLALNNRIDVISENIEFEIYLGKNLKYLGYTSYIYNQLEANQFKSVDRALKIRKFPSSSSVDQLRIDSIKLRKLEQELQLLRRPQSEAAYDEIIVFSSSEDKIKKVETEIYLLKKQALLLAREMLLQFSTKPLGTIDTQVYKMAKGFIKKWFSRDLKEMPFIPK